MTPSPIRCRGTWKMHKRISEPDRWLEEMGFFRKHIARDSSCLFRIVSEHVFNTQRYFHRVRLECVEFMASRRNLFEGSINCPFESYLNEMSNASEWGGFIEISALSHLYRRDFIIFEANKGPQTKISNGYNSTIFLFYSPDTKHFDAVYTKEYIVTSSFCQSLVYEMLYDGVYELKELPYAVDKMLHDKLATNHLEYFMSDNVERRKKQKERAKIFIEATTDNKDKNTNTLALKCKHHTEDIEKASLLKDSLSIFVLNRSLIQLENVCVNCLNVNSAKDLLENGITPFPYKVAKALDPDIYRNIEFDVWSDLRRELRYGARYSDGTTLQVGVKCLCKLQPDQLVPYHCHIQEMTPDGGPCLVFIEELGEKRVLNYDQLEPLPSDEVRPWAPPYRYTRANSQILTISQLLQQLGSMTRKQGAAKARSKAKSITEDNPQTSDPEVVSPTPVSVPQLCWSDEVEKSELTEINTPYLAQDINFVTYQHLDFLNFQPGTVEIEALPLMVDCRPPAAHELPHNGAPPPPPPAPDHHAQPPRINGGEMGGPNGPTPITSPAPVRASTPAANNVINAYAGMVPTAAAYGGGAMIPAPYCGLKSVMWCAPPHPAAAPHPAPAPAPPPPPPGVNPHVYKSTRIDGADLPAHDIPTLRFYYNLGVECMWAAYGAPPHPPRHYSPRDITQELQAMCVSERGEHKHKPQDKPHPHPHPHHLKNNSQRPLLPPRFKRGGNNQDGNNQNNHNKGPNNHNNNNMNNKGPNNRRNSSGEGRPRGPPPASEEPAQYLPPCAPMYPVHYYQEHDPAMLGMMNVGYVFEEPTEYVPYLPAPPYPPPFLPPQHHPHPPIMHHEHK